MRKLLFMKSVRAKLFAMVLASVMVLGNAIPVMAYDYTQNYSVYVQENYYESYLPTLDEEKVAEEYPTLDEEKVAEEYPTLDEEKVAEEYPVLDEELIEEYPTLPGEIAPEELVYWISLFMAGALPDDTPSYILAYLEAWYAARPVPEPSREDLLRTTAAVRPASGAGSASSPFVITLPGHMRWMAQQVNAGSGAGFYQRAHFRLGNDISLAAWTAWEPIGLHNRRFYGTFDGNNHSITGLNVNHTENAGLFGFAGADSVIQNLRVSGNVRGTTNSGGIAGTSWGHILNTHFNGNVTTTTNSGAGGIVGTLAGGRARLDGSSSAGSATGVTGVGGIIGVLSPQNIVTRNTSSSRVIVTNSAGNGGGIIGSTMRISNANGQIRYNIARNQFVQVPRGAIFPGAGRILGDNQATPFEGLGLYQNFAIASMHTNGAADFRPWGFYHDHVNGESFDGTLRVTSVTVQPTSVNLSVGESATITATVRPAIAENRAVVWSSEDASVVSVDQNGRVTVHNADLPSVRIWATTVCSNRTASVLVNILVPVSGIVVEPKTATVEAGATVDLTAIITPSNASNQNVVWRSDNPAAATVDQNGVVTTRDWNYTEVRIWATTACGGFEDYADITLLFRPQPSGNLAFHATGARMYASSEESHRRLASMANNGERYSGNNYNSWMAAGVGEEWLKVDFGERRNFDRIIIFQIGARIRAYELQYSNDGINWNTFHSGNHMREAWLPNHYRYIHHEPMRARYVRILSGFSNNDTLGISIMEFQVFYGDPDDDGGGNDNGSDPTPSINFAHGSTGATMSASSSANARPPSNANNGEKDGRAVNSWAAADSDLTWLRVDLGVQRNFNQIRIYQGGARITDYRLEYSNDGINWTYFHRNTGRMMTQHPDAYVYTHHTVITARFVRIISARSSGIPIVIHEFEVYLVS